MIFIKHGIGSEQRYSVTYEPQNLQSWVRHVVIVVVDITDMRRPAKSEQSGPVAEAVS